MRRPFRSRPHKRRPSSWHVPIRHDDPVFIRDAFVRHVQTSLGRDEYSATPWARYFALCLAVREPLLTAWINTQQSYYHADARRVYYLSMEFLTGRALHNAMVNLGMLRACEEAMETLGFSLAELEDLAVEPGLGNGGLGRLAACFLDSMATLELPAYGCGLRYEYGIFRQEIQNGEQIEEPDDWLRLPNPWELARPESSVRVRFGGRVQVYEDSQGRIRHRWVNTKDVLATPYDTPVPGYGNMTVNTLRLWSARGTEVFHLEDFNAGDYVGAVSHKVMSENITQVLYPNDNLYAGKELRLKQQYLLVAATIEDAIRRHLVLHQSLDDLSAKVVFQLNDTHPALAVAELLRVLLDDYGYDWQPAWKIVEATMAYTNHTLLPEALEKWPVELMERLLPRHVQLITEINRRFLEDVRERFPADEGMASRLSLFEEGEVKRIRMAHLAVVGSYSVNGVAQLHSRLLKERVLPDFARLWPKKFNNKTNGVTQRRWLLCANPRLAELISERIGEAWIKDLTLLRGLEAPVPDHDFLQQLEDVKAKAKKRLSEAVKDRFGVLLDPSTLFDIQIKRIHEYKRQLLNILHVVYLFQQIKRGQVELKTAHTFIFGGKAAPGYTMAKLVIKLIHDVAAMIDSDKRAREQLKVFFYPNYNVSAGELLFPAADVSEQISTAGFEASGTGNMKFALNGALTLGTLDGANIEIAHEVGPENIFIFGMRSDEVRALRESGYSPKKVRQADAAIDEVMSLLEGDFFNPSQPGLYQPLVESLMERDDYFIFADFDAYRRAHQEVDEAYVDRLRWNRMALANIARVGRFSSDRTVYEYNEEIWKVQPQPIADLLRGGSHE